MSEPKKPKQTKKPLRLSPDIWIRERPSGQQMN
jgi:hypothetical protein